MQYLLRIAVVVGGLLALLLIGLVDLILELGHAFGLRCS